eukprot:403346822
MAEDLSPLEKYLNKKKNSINVSSRNQNQNNIFDLPTPSLEKFQSKKYSVDASSLVKQPKQFLTFDVFKSNSKLTQESTMYCTNQSFFQNPYLMNQTFTAGTQNGFHINITNQNDQLLGSGDKSRFIGNSNHQLQIANITIPTKKNQAVKNATNDTNSFHAYNDEQLNGNLPFYSNTINPLRLGRTTSRSPQIDITEKLKVNMGFVSFKKAKNLSPVKFQYKQTDKHESLNANHKYFKQNPQLSEFMKVIRIDEKKEDGDTNNPENQSKKSKNQNGGGFMNKRIKNVKEKSLLKTDKKALGIYDRFDGGGGYQSKTGGSEAPPAGSYFKYKTPLRSAQGGQKLVFLRDSNI